MISITVHKKFKTLIASLTALVLIAGCSRHNNDTISEQYHYDNEGRLIAKTSPDGNTTQYNYDDQGLLTEIIYPKSRVQYGYDKNGNRIWMQDPTGMTEYYYNAFDRLIGVISKHSPWRLIWYDYDPWGYLRYMAILNLQMLEQELKYRDFLQKLQQDLTLRQQTWPEYEFKLSEMLSRLQQESAEAKQRWFEYEVKYNYDLTGNIKQIVTSSGPINYSIDAQKNQVKRQLPNGITTTMTYSPERLLQSIRHEDNAKQLIAEYRYEYTAAGKVVKVEEETLEGTKRTGFEWDSRGYLKNLLLPNGQTQTFAYDAMGNRISEQNQIKMLQYDYDPYGRLLRAGDLEYEWDKNGNLISQTEKQLRTQIQYDDRNLLSLAMTPQTTVQYNWDGDGNLLSSDASTDFSHYLQNPLAPPGFTLAEYDRNNRLKLSYLYGDVLLGQRDMNGQMQYFLEDGFNSIRYVADIRGQIIGRQDFSPSGNFGMTTGKMSGFQMAGQRLLPELKTYSLIGGSLYSPQLGIINQSYSLSQVQHLAMGTDLTEKELRQLEPEYYAMIDALDDAPDITDVNSFIRLMYFETPGLILSHWIRQGAIVAKFFDRTSISSIVAAFATRGELFFSNLINAHRGGHLITDPLLGLQQGEKQANDYASYWRLGRGIVNAYEGSYKSPPDIIEKRFNTKLFGIKSTQAFGKWFFFRELGKFIGGEKDNNRITPSRKGDSKNKYSITSTLPQLELSSPKPPRRKRDVLIPPSNNYPLFFWRRGPPPPMIGGDGGESSSLGVGDDDGNEPPGGGAGSGFVDPFKSIEKQLGGIKLDATAKFFGDIGNITGAVYDPEKKCVVLLGEREVSLPAMKPEDLAIALYSVFGSNPQDLAFSLDPADPANPRGKWLKAVYIPEEILAGTSFGQVMFKADWLLKQYSFGVRIDSSGKIYDRKSSVQGFKSTADLAFETTGGYDEERWARFWIVADDMDGDDEHNMTLQLASDGNSIYYDIAKMAIRAKKQIPDPTSPTGLRDVDTRDDPIATEFARLFTEQYDEISKESPEFGQVKELAKAVALAKWLKRQQIPVDLSWVTDYANKRVGSVGRITALSAVKEKREETPFSRNDQQGIQTSIQQIHLFGGVDSKVNPKFVVDNNKTQRMQEAVRERLRNGNPSPIFTIELDGKTHKVVVSPLTKNGQEIWKNSPTVEIDGTEYQFNDRGELTRSITRYGGSGGRGGTVGSDSSASDGGGSGGEEDNFHESSHGHGHSHEDTTDYEYDAKHRLKKVKASNSDGWKIIGEKNDTVSVWTWTNPKGAVFQYKYNGLGQLTEFGVNGERWATYEIDQSQRKVSVRYADRVEKMSYDRNGNITAYEISNGNTTEKLLLDYNQSGQLMKIKGTAMPAVNIVYDKNGVRPVSIITSQDTMDFEYNPDESIKKITLSSGLSASYFYQAQKLAKLQIDRQNKDAEYWFDENGLTRSKDFLGGIFEYGYSHGKLTSVTQNQDSTRYVYDDRNRLREVHFPNGGWIEYQYYEQEKARDRKVTSSYGRILTVTTHPAPGSVNNP